MPRRNVAHRARLLEFLELLLADERQDWRLQDRTCPEASRPTRARTRSSWGARAWDDTPRGRYPIVLAASTETARTHSLLPSCALNGALPTDSHAGRQASVLKRNGVAWRSLRVAEDDAILLDAMAYTFQAEGQQVLSRADGVRGRDLARDPALDLMLPHIMLPGMSGSTSVASCE